MDGPRTSLGPFFKMKLDLNLMQGYLDKGLITKNDHPSLPLLIWNYTPKTQYERVWDKVTILCRSLVTDLNGAVVAKSFDKFFNIEEETCLPCESFNVYEKLDGSLILVFWYEDNLVVSSRKSFCSDHAREALEILKNYDISCLEKNKSYSFELIVPWNRIVCDYGNSRKLVLLAKFDNEGNEYDINEYEDKFPLARVFEFDSLNEIKKNIPSNEEGYVIKFKGGKRVKIKGEEYVRMHKLLSSVTESSILDMLSDGRHQELENILFLLPDEIHNWAKSTKLKMESRFQEIFSECSHSFRRFDSRKEAAAYFLTQKYPHILFLMLDNQKFDDMIWKVIRSEIK